MTTSVRTTILLPEDRLKSLKKLAFEQGSSIGRLINEAVDKAFFRKSKKNFSNLRGLWKKHKISDRDIAEARIRLKEFPT